jgi:hypothetical protein
LTCRARDEPARRQLLQQPPHIAVVVPERLPEMFAKMQAALVRTAKPRTFLPAPPIRYLAEEWSVAVQPHRLSLR